MSEDEPVLMAGGVDPGESDCLIVTGLSEKNTGVRSVGGWSIGMGIGIGIAGGAVGVSMGPSGK